MEWWNRFESERNKMVEEDFSIMIYETRKQFLILFKYTLSRTSGSENGNEKNCSFGYIVY